MKFKVKRKKKVPDWTKDFKVDLLPEKEKSNVVAVITDVGYHRLVNGKSFHNTLAIAKETKVVMNGRWKLKSKVYSFYNWRKCGTKDFFEEFHDLRFLIGRAKRVLSEWRD